MIVSSRYLTSNYAKTEESNNYKLLSLADDGLNEIFNTIGLMETYRDLDVAPGKTLDRIGKNVLEARTTEDDAIYRKLIHVKIRSNFSKTDIETLNEIATALLGDAFEGIGETWSKARYNHEPAGLFIRARDITIAPELIGSKKTLNGAWYLNGDYYLNGGYEVRESVNPLERLDIVKEIMNRVKAGGVRLYWEIPLFSNIQTQISINLLACRTVKKRSSLFGPIEAWAQNKVAKQVRDSRLPFLLDGRLPLCGVANLEGSRDKVLLNAVIKEVKRDAG